MHVPELKTNFINEKIIDILKKFMNFDSLSSEEIKQLLFLDRPMHTGYQARIASEKKREHLIVELQNALSEVKTLTGLLPICSHCKKIRDDKGYWNQIEAYIREHSDAKFSHGICRECAQKYYPDYDIYERRIVEGSPL